jgi:hypothetical protein
LSFKRSLTPSVELKLLHFAFLMRSEDFFDKFDTGLAGDNQDTMLWAAEYEALKLLENELQLFV